MTLELEIKGEVYSFKAGFGFMRELNSKVTTKVDGTKLEEKIGLTYYLAKLRSGDIEALCTILNVANKGQTPRLKVSDLEAYLEDEDTDIDDLFEQVKSFLSKSNVCKQTWQALTEQAQTEK